MQLDEGREGGVDLTFAAGLQDMELHPLRARRFLHVLQSCARCSALFGFTSRAITPAWGTSSESSSSRLGISSPVREPTPVRLPPGRARLATRPAATRSPTAKTIGIVEVALFAASAAGCRRRDHVDVAADEVGGQCGQPIVVAIRPAVLDRQILSLDIAGFVQSLVERGHIWCKRPGRADAEEADHRHRLLLRARGRAPQSSRRPAAAATRGASFDDFVGAASRIERRAEAERLRGA